MISKMKLIGSNNKRIKEETQAMLHLSFQQPLKLQVVIVLEELCLELTLRVNLNFSKKLKVRELTKLLNGLLNTNKC